MNDKYRQGFLEGREVGLAEGKKIGGRKVLNNLLFYVKKELKVLGGKQI